MKWSYIKSAENFCRRLHLCAIVLIQPGENMFIKIDDGGCTRRGDDERENTYISVALISKIVVRGNSRVKMLVFYSDAGTKLGEMSVRAGDIKDEQTMRSLLGNQEDA